MGRVRPGFNQGYISTTRLELAGTHRFDNNFDRNRGIT
ncbi:MAG: hypothetical protein HLUCCO16_09435 [Phormidium sp. OSCR]|nr:MAG: hypothetical protein HLUCCO16_09435 [Phormidium sp. OSCR]